MVYSESELRLVELFTFPGYIQNLFERSNWVNLHGAARLRNDFCQEKNYISFKNKLYLLGLQDFGIRIVSLKYHHSSLSIPPN